MKQAPKSRSGRIVFVIVFLLIITGIAGTVLLANNGRNLDLVMKKLGYDTSAAEHSAPVLRRPVITVRKGRRLPPERMVLPAYAFADMKSAPPTFLRLIQSDPRTLCERLQDGGFSGMTWTTGSADATGRECSSIVTIPPTATSGAAQSSVFVSIKGDAGDRVTSFRVKLNIENPADSALVSDAAGRAVSIFLSQVRWEKPEAVIGKIGALEEFDLNNFGSRIQFKREYGETPRYNFLASQSATRRRESVAEVYFNRRRWLPLTDMNGLPMIDGMMAGEMPDGLSLNENTTSNSKR